MKRQPHGDSPPALPLYLISSRSLSARIDGPALKISGPGEPVRRYPFARLSRVIAGETVDWQGRAIAMLLRQGIPIVLLEQSGGVSGYLQAALHHGSDLAQMLHEFSTRPDWEGKYQDWQRSIRMRLVEDWSRRRQRIGTIKEKKLPEQLIRETVYHIVSADLPYERLVKAVVSGVVVKMLRDKLLLASYPAYAGGCIDLAHDLSELLTYLVTLELFACGYRIEGDDASLLHLLHRYSGTIEGKGSWMLALLQQHLTGVLAEWQ